MLFRHWTRWGRIKSTGAYLREDSWDDYTFKTLFTLEIVDDDGPHEIGVVRIAYKGMPERSRTPIPDEFDSLPDGYFSVAADVSYYANLQKLGNRVRETVLRSLKDVAFDKALLAEVQEELVFKKSLLREREIRTVEDQFSRAAHGGVINTRYYFRYSGPTAQAPYILEFDVQPHSYPPTNMHVLIGGNGVGKTRILNQIAYSVSDAQAQPEITGNILDENGQKSEPFVNVAALSFNAFDTFRPVRHHNGVTYHSIGLHMPSRSDDMSQLRGDRELGKMFETSVHGFRPEEVKRWQRALEVLRTDSLFEDVYTFSLSRSFSSYPNPSSVFGPLSSGQKVVLLGITELIKITTERTLVLVDEPENHLHPPLLSAFVRALSDILIDRNAVAIVATHSPVVLQEVPRTCVSKLRRIGSDIVVEKPEIETFGENVGVLTREAFGLEVTRSGFHQMISSLVDSGYSFEQIIAEFGGQLGAEAMRLARVLTAIRDRSGQ